MTTIMNIDVFWNEKERLNLPLHVALIVFYGENLSLQWSDYRFRSDNDACLPEMKDEKYSYIKLFVNTTTEILKEHARTDLSLLQFGKEINPRINESGKFMIGWDSGIKYIDSHNNLELMGDLKKKTKEMSGK